MYSLSTYTRWIHKNSGITVISSIEYKINVFFIKQWFIKFTNAIQPYFIFKNNFLSCLLCFFYHMKICCFDLLHSLYSWYLKSKNAWLNILWSHLIFQVTWNSQAVKVYNNDGLVFLNFGCCSDSTNLWIVGVIHKVWYKLSNWSLSLHMFILHLYCKMQMLQSLMIFNSK